MAIFNRKIIELTSDKTSRQRKIDILNTKRYTLHVLKPLFRDGYSKLHEKRVLPQKEPRRGLTPNTNIFQVIYIILQENLGIFLHLILVDLISHYMII